MYSLSWCVSTVISGVVYYGLHKLSPMEVTGEAGYVIEGLEGESAELSSVGQEGGKAFDA